MEDYICDDRMYEPGGLLDQVMNLTGEDLEAFIQKLKEEEEE